MRPTRRQVVAALGGTALGLATAACSGTLPKLRLTAADVASHASGTIHFWYRAGTQTTVEAMIRSFHAGQDRVRVEATPVADGQYVTKLATAIRGGRVPDLVDLDDINGTLFAYREAFADVTELIDTLPYADRLSPGHLNLGTRGGRRYAVPFFADNSALACNTELFDRAGLDVDEATRDFTGLLAAARRIDRLGADIHGWYLPGNSSGGLGFTVLPHVWAAGGRLLRGPVGHQSAHVAASRPLRDTLRLLATMWRERLMPRICYSDDGSRWAGEFAAGRVGMLPCSYGIVVPNLDPALRRAVRFVLLPGPDGGRAFFDGGDNLAIPNGAANPAAAWQFVRYCLDVPRQQLLPKANYLPVRADALTPAFARRYPLAVPPLAHLDAGYAPSTLPYNLIFNQSDGPWLRMLRRAVFDGDVSGALDAGQRGFDILLRQAQL